MKDQTCIKCDKKRVREELLIIKLKDIVESWNFDHIGQSNAHKFVPQQKTKSKP
jgi:hypothetical protein